MVRIRLSRSTFSAAGLGVAALVLTLGLSAGRAAGGRMGEGRLLKASSRRGSPDLYRLLALAVPGRLRGVRGGPAAELGELLARAEGYLPTGFAREVAARSRVRFHRDSSLRRADYIEAAGRLDLYGPAFVRDGELVDLGSQSNDAVAALFEALLAAHAAQVWLQEAGARQSIEERARSIYGDVPAERQVEVYLDAVGQMTGHLFSMAAGVERSHRKLGPLLCRRFHYPLFRLWERSFVDVPYLGAYYRRAGPGRGEWVSSRVNLPSEDRRWLVREIAGDAWIGEARTDFASAYCGPDRAAAAPPAGAPVG